MKEPKFKVGDWCYYEFELHQVKETEEDRITSVSDGFALTGSHDISNYCFPVEMEVKKISDEVSNWYKDVRKAAGISNINYPQIHRKFVDLWRNICENRNNDKLYEKYWDELCTFGNDLLRKLRDMGLEEVDGIRILRQ
jgi:hypothetical protein